MGNKDPRVDAYIQKAAPFAQPILQHIRGLMHKGCPDVQETMKWSMPHFEYKGILCGMAAFKQHCAWNFWKSRLFMKSAVANEAMGDFGRITSTADLPKDSVLLGYIKEAARLNEQGIKLPAQTKAKEKKELVVPEYFTAALRKNKKAQAMFDAFSASHKKEYVQWITEAKTEETRQRRLQNALEWLEEGKSRNWKYDKC